MVSLNLPAFFQRFKRKDHGRRFQIEDLNQEEIRDLQRIRRELELAHEKQRLQILLHQRTLF